MIDDAMKYLPSVRDVFQILFFVIIGVVTILTYSKAKRTLLQPFRTEVFKEQIKLFGKLLNFLTGRDEVALREAFGFDQLFEANTAAMFDSFRRIFFDAKIDRSTRPYRTELCPHAIVREKHIVPASGPFRETVQPAPVPLSPSEKTDAWSRYELSPLYLPKELVDAEEKFRQMLDSPLLPIPCVKLGESLLSTVKTNTMLLETVLNEAAKELPEKYPNVDTLRKASPNWIRTMYVRRFEFLAPKAKEITSYLREYYLSDQLLNT